MTGLKNLTFALSPLIVSISVSSPNLKVFDEDLLGLSRAMVIASPFLEIFVITFAFFPASMYSLGTPTNANIVN